MKTIVVSNRKGGSAKTTTMDKMQAEFCQRHNFSVSEQFGTYTVFIKAHS